MPPWHNQVSMQRRTPSAGAMAPVVLCNANTCCKLNTPVRLLERHIQSAKEEEFLKTRNGHLEQLAAPAAGVGLQLSAEDADVDGGDRHGGHQCLSQLILHCGVHWPDVGPSERYCSIDGRQ